MGKFFQLEGLLRAVNPYREAVGSLAVRGVGIMAGFVLTFLIGRWYGPAANGQFAIVSQTALFAATIAIGGLDLAVIKEFSRSGVVGARLARRTIAFVLGQSACLALFLSALLWLGSGKLLHWLGRPELPEKTLPILCLLLLTRTLTRMLATILRSQSRFLFSQAVEMLVAPLLTLVFLVVGLGGSVEEILLASLLAGAATVVLGLYSTWREADSGPDAMTVTPGKLYATALPLWGVAITQNLADWYGLATITAIGGLADAGTFRVASQFSSAFSIVVLGLLGTYSAQISSAYHANDRERAARLAGQANKLAMALMIPPALVCIVFAGPLLGLIGPEFAADAAVLRILIVGQIAFAIAGTASTVLAMSGHPRVNLQVNIFTTLAILICAPLAVRWWGGAGLAAFLSAASLSKAIVYLLVVRRLERIDVLTGRVLPG